MVSKDTGRAVEVASSDYAMEAGIMISRSSLYVDNGTSASSGGLDPAVRRRLLQDDSTSGDEEGDQDGSFEQPVVTAPLTDVSGALMAADGSDATCARMTYYEDPDDLPGGWGSVFELPSSVLPTIEGLAMEVGVDAIRSGTACLDHRGLLLINSAMILPAVIGMH